MKTTIRRASAILAAGSVLAAILTGPPATATAACDPATRAIQYLASNQKADGSLDMSSAGGFGNPGATTDMAIGAAAGGLDPGTIHQPGGTGIYDYLGGQAGTVSSDAGKTAKLLVALAAGNTPAGKFDYHSFGGQDLLGKLTSATPGGFYHPTGVATGSYGDGSTFTQALSILAVKATGGTPPTASLTWLRGLENSGSAPDTQNTGFSFKGWSSAGASNAAQGDTNSTGIALEALVGAGDTSRNAAALAWLHTQQNTDGGFPFATPSVFGTASDADSDALVLEALAATGQTLSSWQVSGNTPLTNLVSMQDPAGGFSAPSPDTFTTSQVPPALAGKAFPISAPTASATVPAAGCPAPTGVNAAPLAAQSTVPGLPVAGAEVARPESLPAPGLALGLILITCAGLLGAQRRLS